jgi:hypothetical protein
MTQQHWRESIRDAVERFVTDVTIEVRGDAILKAGSRDWSGIEGGKRAVVGQQQGSPNLELST